MKKLMCVMSLLLIIVMLGSLTAVAAEAEGDDVYAVAITVGGEEIVLSDAPDVEEIGALDSYELMIENDLALTVEQSDIPDPVSGTDNNGYFSADFAIPDTSKQVFLAGLSADRIEEIQQKIIESYASGADFELTDLSFIDAEKMCPSGDGDDNLCWAATTANMLTYTGWAAQAGFDTTDDVLESFIGAFSDSGGSPYYGAGWFFNGVNTLVLTNGDEAASAASGTGGYLTDYAYDMLAENINIQSDAVGGVDTIDQSLRDGSAVGLSLTVYFKGSYSGGHAVTCWGVITDTAYELSDPAHFSGLFITDSDSDEPLSGDRRDAPNNLQAVSLTVGSDANGVLTYEFDLDKYNHAVLREINLLQPYSADVEKETDPSATRDKVNGPDLVIPDLYFGTDLSASYQVSIHKIESGVTFFYTPVIGNEADTDYTNKSTEFAMTVTDADGNTVASRSFTTNLTARTGYIVDFGNQLRVSGGLTEGDYVLTMTLNGDHKNAEAYYYNNIYRHAFKVRDSYLLGDADGSGDVGIMDATQIQRYLADYDVGADDKMIRRASVIGSDVGIMDATQIQRHLASYETSYAIGEKQLYD